MSNAEPDFQAMYIRLRGRTLGPFDLTQLRALHQRGQFSRAHEVSVDRQSWQSAATLERIFQPTKRKTANEIGLTENKPAVNAVAPGVDSPKSVKPIWHYNIGDESHGPVTLVELRGLASNGQLDANDLVWKSGMTEWVPAGDIEELQSSLLIRIGAPARAATASGTGQNYCYACGCGTDARAEICPKCGVRQPSKSLATKSRVSAALFAFFLGGLGAHHFYLGHVGFGVFYLLFCWTFIPALVALFEGISYLSMSDAQFAARYSYQ